MTRHSLHLRLRRLTVALALGAGVTCLGPTAGTADDLSGTDKLRALYSDEFSFTRDGWPLVPVAIAEGLHDVTISASGGLRVLPEGEGGPELRADSEWRVELESGTPARLRYWSVVFRGGPEAGPAASAEAAGWKGRGESALVFEQGTLFAVAGEVLDRRELLVGIGPRKTVAEAEAALDALSRKAPFVTRGVHTEMVERPHGVLVATGAKTGARLRNEGVIWFHALTDEPLRVATPTGTRTYAGRVYVTLDRKGTLAVVNAVPEDRLLAGLVPAEIFPNAPDEALKAQAVAARGELLAKIGKRHHGDPFRLCSTTHCQVYAGTGKETPRTTAAVTATRGQVLFGPGGKDLADTVYSANCGGHTEHNDNVWPDMAPDPLLRGHLDVPGARPSATPQPPGEAELRAFLDHPPAAFCGRSRLGAGDRFRWTVRRSQGELASLLGPLGVGPVRTIEVTQRGVSGRARAVRIVGEKRTETVQGELRIRQTFGGLRSSLFLASVSGGAATFEGAGFGHGVGMCQTGAVGMAEAGLSYRDILSHYYSGSVLRKLW